ncbi:MAG TPA: hypothetical protein VHQ86_04725 [Candidatus Saccharimonadia bacterium]|nr:hypothetical protein [Candidatus Saccharimonadia bacterium]
MALPPSFRARLREVLVPTFSQGLGSIFIALVILVGLDLDQFLQVTGLGTLAIGTARDALHDRFHLILTSPAVSNLALITFWAAVGLLAYLACWSAYNLIIGARNEITLNTEYTNRSHWQSHIEDLSVKATGALLLVGLVALLKPGLSLWLALGAPALITPGAFTIATGIVAVLGLALQLYAILALVLITFTPWYRAETFTN